MFHFYRGEMFVYPAFQFQFNRNQIDSNYIFLYNPAYRYMKLNLIIHGWVDGFPSTYKVNDEGWYWTLQFTVTSKVQCSFFIFNAGWMLATARGEYLFQIGPKCNQNILLKKKTISGNYSLGR